MNKLNKRLFIALSSMFAIACYAQSVTDVQESISINTKSKSPCADIKDPVEKRACVEKQIALFFN